MTDSPAYDRELPAALADAVAAAFETTDSPRTLGDVADVAARRIDGSDVEGYEALCVTESSRHAARIGEETEHFACVLDTLVVPFLREAEEAVEVRSESPVSDSAVELLVDREGVAATPESAVLSFGVATDLPPPDERRPLPRFAYGALCPYVQAFPDRAEYEEWADRTDAATTALSPATGHALARRLGEVLSG